MNPPREVVAAVEKAKGHPVVFLPGVAPYSKPDEVLRARRLHAEPGFELVVETWWVEAGGE